MVFFNDIQRLRGNFEATKCKQMLKIDIDRLFHSS